MQIEATIRAISDPITPLTIFSVDFPTKANVAVTLDEGTKVAEITFMIPPYKPPAKPPAIKPMKGFL